MAGLLSQRNGFFDVPAGGIVIGYIGDRVGEQTALTVFIVARAMPTCLIIGLTGYLLRREAPEHSKRSSAATTNPVVETLKNHRPDLAKIAGISAFLAVSFYLRFVYVVSWLELVDKIPPSKSLEPPSECWFGPLLVG